MCIRDRRCRSYLLCPECIPLHLYQRHPLCRHRSRSGCCRRHDGILLQGNQLDRLRGRRPRLLRRRIHGLLLQHFLRPVSYTQLDVYKRQVDGQMPGDVLNDEEGLATMDSLAENMLWLLEKIK